MNIGYSSRMVYDDDYYADKVAESTYGINYRIDKDLIYNDNRCRSDYGPRSGFMGNGVSVPNDLGYAESQSLTYLENIFTNRNVKASRSKKGGVNPIDPITTYTLYNQKQCSNYLDPMYTLETNPKSNYRGIEINRFENLPRNPQNHIFYDFAVNTQLEAIDNFVPEMPNLWPDLSQPKPAPEQKIECIYDCETKSKKCPKAWRRQ